MRPGGDPLAGTNWPAVLLRLSYLAVSSVFTMVRLLPVSDTGKDIEILALSHQLTILQRQSGRPRLTGTRRRFLAALLRHLPRAAAAAAVDRVPGHHRGLAS